MPGIYTSNAIKCNGEQRYKESVRDERGEHEQTKGSTIPDFEGGMGDFRKKDVLQTDFEGKKFLQGNTWRKKFLH